MSKIVTQPSRLSETLKPSPFDSERKEGEKRKKENMHCMRVRGKEKCKNGAGVLILILVKISAAPNRLVWKYKSFVS